MIVSKHSQTKLEKYSGSSLMMMMMGLGCLVGGGGRGGLAVLLGLLLVELLV